MKKSSPCLVIYPTPDEYSLMILVVNTTLQLNALYSKNSPYYKIFSGVPFTYPLKIISRALVLLLTLDSLITENIFYANPYLKQHWVHFKESFNLLKIDPTKFEVDKKDLRLLERIIVKVDKGVMSGRSLDHFFHVIMDDRKLAMFVGGINVLKTLRTSKPLFELFKSYLKREVAILDRRVGSRVEVMERRNIAENLCLFAFVCKMFKTEIKDVWKGLWSIQKKCYSVNLHEFVLVNVADFMKRYCPTKKSYSGLDPKNSDLWIEQDLAVS